MIALGVDTFIYRDDIEEYIDNVAKDVVKIIELENYEREIPDEIVSVVEAVKGKFDKLYVLFIKDRKHSVTDEDLTAIYDNCLELLNKYRITGQTKGMRKLIFHLY